jgi:Protein of unknown function (DUF2752)
VSTLAGHRIPLDDGDIRTASALLLGCAAARAAAPGDVGVQCPLRTLTGVPCPLCGMTTSVTATVQLELGEAIAASPAGLALVALAVAVLAGPGRRLVLNSSLVYLALAASWLWQLHRFSIL